MPAETMQFGKLTRLVKTTDNTYGDMESLTMFGTKQLKLLVATLLLVGAGSIAMY